MLRNDMQRTHQEFFNYDYDVIKSLCTEKGVVLAAPAADYNRVWIRDCCEVAYCMLICGKYELGKKILRGVFGILHRHNANSHKIDHIIEYGKPHPTEGWQLFHPLYDKDGNEMFHLNGWGWSQNDALGLFLFCIAKAEEIDEDFLTKKDLNFIQKLVLYLMVVRYWDCDHSVWEECPTENSATITSCIAGLEQVKGLGIYVPEIMLQIGRRKQLELGNKHSHAHPVDLAHLQMYFPLGFSTNRDVLAGIQAELACDYGFMRYPNDSYEAGEAGQPAQWPLGTLWAGLSCYMVGDVESAQDYLAHSDRLRLENGDIPETYRACLENGKTVYRACPHTPLTWAHDFSMALRHKLGLAE
ncbi:MAG: glycoside hydrolase family 15 protein [Candidatus Berkelbacteria bacterium]